MGGCCIRAHLAVHFSHPVPNPRSNKCLPPPFLSNLRKAPLFGGEPYFGIERAVHAVRIPSQKQLHMSLILSRRSSLFFCLLWFVSVTHLQLRTHGNLPQISFRSHPCNCTRNRLHISYETEHFPQICRKLSIRAFSPSCFAPTVCTVHLSFLSSPIWKNKNRLCSIGLRRIWQSICRLTKL